jgi:1-acyl-sn-glycerol-3-phosphate acyltransferase
MTDPAPSLRAVGAAESPFLRAWLILRSTVLWPLSILHFCLIVPMVLVAAKIVGWRRVEWLVRVGSRNIVRLAGARLVVHVADGFDPKRTGFYASNHVNIFDPFVLYASVPRGFRGLELESHFKIPVYGWLMKGFGNVPVPDVRTPSGLKKTYRLAGEAIARGLSLLGFPEGSRTMDGRVGVFEDGVFRMAIQLQVPITPVSIVGSFRWQNKLTRLLRPATVHVHIHEPVQVAGMTRQDLDALRDRVRSTIAAPVHTALGESPQNRRTAE